MACSRLRPARVDEAEELTQVAVRATAHDGYDDGAIARFMPGLKINLALIAAGLVSVAEDEQGAPRGYVALRPTGLGGLILLEGIFVDPAFARSGFGTRLFRDRGRAVEKDGRKCHPDFFKPARGGFLQPSGCHQDRHDAVRVFSRRPAVDVRVYDSCPLGHRGDVGGRGRADVRSGCLRSGGLSPARGMS